ncbi:MAG: hydroxyacylglutathione hydrolase [Deltaproteobacteria bacterium]|nr:hydroxyacylglutathione hydrolase [Deltaproteobacteria bacterium]
MRIVPVPCMQDNYAYLVIDEATKYAAAVDPSEHAPVLAAAGEEGVQLRELWLTHHHFDHVGGIEGITEAVPGLVIRGSAHDHREKRIPKQTTAHGDGDIFAFEGHEVRVIDNPGHTLGAISFFTEGNLFSGDTLFIGGCGRVLEGTMQMMKDSLGRLRELPEDALVWCGHEYTVKNLEYAAGVEPDNRAVAGALAAAKSKRAKGEMTVPGTIGAERSTNPFFRYDVPTIAAGPDDVGRFTALREGKDRF